MNRFAVIILTISFAGCTTVRQQPNDLQQDDYSRRSNFSVPYCDADFHTEPEDRGQACSPDYTAILAQAATKDERALERLFYISANSSWDAAGGEFHVSAMRRMLLVWGDIDFARVLARQPPATRRKIVRNLSFAILDPAIPYLFPHTYATSNP